MRHRSTLLTALLSVTAFASVAAPLRLMAQSPSPLVGKWSVDYEVGRMMENGEETPIRGKGTLTIVQSGDSLLVTIQSAARPDGTVPPPSISGARIADGQATMVQKRTMRMNMNGTESTQDVFLTWTLKAAGDSLTGTLARKMQDMPENGPASPVSGTRIKA
jgi:hypothetical protein